jgi:hypothetical protein
MVTNPLGNESIFIALEHSFRYLSLSSGPAATQPVHFLRHIHQNHPMWIEDKWEGSQEVNPLFTIIGQWLRTVLPFH